MSASTRPANEISGLEAVIYDYNGVIGRQPTASQWIGLGELAGWSAQEIQAFQTAFWQRREEYDEGTLASAEFWAGLLRGGRTARPGSSLLAKLVQADTQMWMTTDAAVLEVLRAAHAAGIRGTLLSNAPRPLADALDATDWCATLITKAVYSARIGINKPAQRAYEAAIAAAGHPRPERTLFVDDRLDNVVAAQRLGLHTHHYTGNAAALARLLPAVPAGPAVPACFVPSVPDGSAAVA
ncbi:HAD-IA family hydrolase [Streptomyces canus]|uniref:HAD-IA family hydrolase n=1 Tax=Streptomyces canus TaxID=58343 RepID=UPI0033F83DB7